MRHSRPGGLRSRLVLAAVAVTALAVIAGPVGTASSDSVAGSAKKRCKKKHRGASAAKRCKRRRATVVTPPTTRIITSKVRGTLTWSSTADLDLHAWNINGQHLGYSNVTGGFDFGIPSAAHSGDDQNGFGPEVITDTAWYEPPTTTLNRQFTFGICQNSNTPTSVQLITVDRLGAQQFWAFTLNTAGAAVEVVSGYNPPNTWC